MNELRCPCGGSHFVEAKDAKPPISFFRIFGRLRPRRSGWAVMCIDCRQQLLVTDYEARVLDRDATVPPPQTRRVAPQSPQGKPDAPSPKIEVRPVTLDP